MPDGAAPPASGGPGPAGCPPAPRSPSRLPRPALQPPRPVATSARLRRNEILQRAPPNQYRGTPRGIGRLPFPRELSPRRSQSYCPNYQGARQPGHQPTISRKRPLEGPHRPRLRAPTTQMTPERKMIGTHGPSPPAGSPGTGSRWWRGAQPPAPGRQATAGRRRVRDSTHCPRPCL